MKTRGTALGKSRQGRSTTSPTLDPRALQGGSNA
jgi:hypothetical protein